MKFKIIDDLAIFFDNTIPEKYLSKLQEFLLSGAIFTDATKVLAMIVIFIIISEIVLALTLAVLNFPVSLLILPFFVIPGLFTYVIVQQEKRAQEIEKTAPEAIVEIRMGRNFDDAWQAMAKRLKSKELERIFNIILDGRKSGSSVSGVLFEVSDDLRDLLALKRERKSTVMMSVMFLLISAIVATPFAIGMVGVYSGFMQNYGMESEIVLTAPVAGEIYLIIHSILVAFIISLIMYGEFKKGIKFSLPLVSASFAIFYMVTTFGGSMFVGGF